VKFDGIDVTMKNSPSSLSGAPCLTACCATVFKKMLPYHLTPVWFLYIHILQIIPRVLQEILSNSEELSKLLKHLFVVMWLLWACCPSLGFGFRIARYVRSKSK
jgi:hypothetical protein